tara:strand:+ start:304 stop:516 length:213 start_codon:yes stop_codon:yes gene_type:complete
MFCYDFAAMQDDFYPKSSRENTSFSESIDIAFRELLDVLLAFIEIQSSYQISIRKASDAEDFYIFSAGPA